MRNELQIQGGIALVGAKPMGFAVQSGLPIAVPDAITIGGGAGPAHSRSGESLKMAKPGASDVGKSEMDHVQIADGPSRRVLRPDRNPGAEEGQLVTKFVPVGRAEIARVVPPLDAEILMGGVIGGKSQRARLPGELPAGCFGRWRGRFGGTQDRTGNERDG